MIDPVFKTALARGQLHERHARFRQGAAGDNEPEVWLSKLKAGSKQS
jgi:hypothetical protein